MLRRFFHFVAVFSVASLALAALPSPVAQAAGATLYLSPSGGTFAVGSTFNVSVLVNTGGQNINAVEADLRFPADKLQVVTPAAGPSVITVWATQPFFSNANGIVNFKGGVPSPGINMSAGSIATITFRVTGVGQAVVSLTDKSKVLLNDGAGTNVLSDRRGSVFTLTLPPPEGPFVSSATHPDPARWYQDKNPVFLWEKQSGITAFSYVLNDKAVDVPDDIPDGDLTSYRYTDLADGVWFFHIKARGPSGWGGVTHFQVKVDATPPAAFPIDIAPRARTSLRQPVIYFTTTDSASGIDHYEIKIIGLDKETAQPGTTPFYIETESPYRPPELALGGYDVIVRAHDRAGNVQEARQKLKIVPAVYQFLGGDGVAVSGRFVIGWPVIWALLAVLAALLLLLLLYVFRRHHEHDAKIRAGLIHIDHPIADDLKLLEQKRIEYGKHL